MGKDSNEYSDEEIARRRDELAKRMLNMPPHPLKPNSAMKLGKHMAEAKPKERPASKGRVHKGKSRI
jgi:hypothetical protein